MYDVITIGDSGQDIFLELNPETAHVYCELNRDECQICFHYADKIPIHAKYDAVGGNAANAATGFARLGLRTAIYTHLGDDRPGTRILEEFQAHGIDPAYVTREHDTETNYNTVLSLDGERTILVYHLPRHYRLPKLAAAKLIYFTSMGEGFDQTVPALLEYMTAHGSRLCFQPGTFQLKYGRKKLAALLQKTSYLFLNKDEAIRYLEADPESSPRALLDGLRDVGCQTVVITDGGNGCYATDGRQYLQLGILPHIHRRESTGAGDAFATGCTAALVSGEPLGEALRWGLCEASSVIQQVGAQAGLLTHPALAAMLKEYTSTQALPVN